MIENIMLFFFAAFIAFSVSAQEIDQKFTIAVIPDTQNMVDYRHQPEEGYAVDGGAMFLEQMDYIADNSVTNGGGSP